MATTSLDLSVKTCILVLLAAAAIVHLAGAHHHNLHCKKWHSNCLKYEKYCDNETSNETAHDLQKQSWKSCCEIRQYVGSGYSPTGLKSDVYFLHHNGPFVTLQAYCDTETDGGGWTVITRRVDNETDFNRNLKEYEEGFGDLHGNFWYGLRTLHQLTDNNTWELRIDIYDENNVMTYAHYDQFRVEGAMYNYRLFVAGYTADSTAADSLSGFSMSKFSTHDKDLSGADCPSSARGGWWYVHGTCRKSRGSILTAKYGSQFFKWYTITETSQDYVFYPKYEVKIRPSDCVSS